LGQRNATGTDVGKHPMTATDTNLNTSLNERAVLTGSDEAIALGEWIYRRCRNQYGGMIGEDSVWLRKLG
jgi:hypothetical protein